MLLLEFLNEDHITFFFFCAKILLTNCIYERMLCEVTYLISNCFLIFSYNSFATFSTPLTPKLTVRQVSRVHYWQKKRKKSIIKLQLINYVCKACLIYKPFKEYRHSISTGITERHRLTLHRLTLFQYYAAILGFP